MYVCIVHVGTPESTGKGHDRAGSQQQNKNRYIAKSAWMKWKNEALAHGKRVKELEAELEAHKAKLQQPEMTQFLPSVSPTEANIAQERLEALLVDMKTSNPAGYTALYGQLHRLVVQRYTEKQDNTKRKK